jgi:hypothetical protein
MAVKIMAQYSKNREFKERANLKLQHCCPLMAYITGVVFSYLQYQKVLNWCELIKLTWPNLPLFGER